MLPFSTKAKMENDGGCQVREDEDFCYVFVVAEMSLTVSPN